MAKKIIKGVGKALGISKKKKSAPEEEVADTSKHEPIIKELPGLEGAPRRRRLGPRPANTILGGSETLG